MSKQMADIKDILKNVQDVKVVLVGAGASEQIKTGVFSSKEEHDTHIYMMVRNLIHDQAAYNINHREEYMNLRDAHSILKEEVEETVDALDDVLIAENEIWKQIKADDTEEEMMAMFEHVEQCAVDVIIEALHVAAVANKAITQFRLQAC